MSLVQGQNFAEPEAAWGCLHGGLRKRDKCCCQVPEDHQGYVLL